MLLALSIGAAGIACGGGSDDSEKDESERDAPAGKKDAGKGDRDDADDEEDADDVRDAGGRASDAGPTRGTNRDAAATDDDVDIDVVRTDASTTPNDGVDGEDETPPTAGRDAGTTAKVTGCNRSSCDQIITQVTAGAQDLRDLVKSCCVSTSVCGYSLESPDAPASQCMSQEQIAGMADEGIQTSTAR
jgi:hypothetical protein